MIVNLLTWLAAKGIISNDTLGLRPAPISIPPSRDDKIRAARRSLRLAHEMARRQRVIPVRIVGAGVTLHSRYRSYP